jgi:inner membrane protein
MMWRTHVMAGINTLWLLQPLPVALNPETLLPLATAATLGALLPDLDAKESKIKSLQWQGVRPFAPLSGLVYETLGHRGPLHSLGGLMITGALAIGGGWLMAGLWPHMLWGGSAGEGLLRGVALTLGYASHLAADACTRSGIQLLYIPHFHPDRRRYHLLPQGWRFTTGSSAEEALLAVLALLAWLLCWRLLFQSLTLQS